MIAVLLAAATAVAIGQPRVERGYSTSVSPRVVEIYSQRFGPQARVRLEAWKRDAAERKRSPARGAALERALLSDVNRLLNRVAFVDDTVHWREADYWATPAESIGSHGADCEDFSIAKYFLLKELGVPIARLRLTYVKSLSLNQAHMVLAYYAAPGSEPLILDNLEDRVRAATERPDLVPVYSFNDEDVMLVRDSRKSNPRQIRAWRDLLTKLEAETRL